MNTFIATFDNALPESLCRSLIERFDAGTDQQMPGRTGAGLDQEKKRSTDITLDRHVDWSALQRQIADCAFRCLCQYAAAHHFLLVGALSPTVRHPMTGAPVTLDDSNFREIGARFVPALLQRCFTLGVMNLQRYEQSTGGYPHWHSEIYPQSSTTDALHRVLFWMCYLNDVEVGGETEFAYQGTKIQPRAGRLLIAPAGFTHTHRGNSPQSSSKYVITSWLLYRRALE